MTGGEIGSKKPIHPNDHVNMSQSSNDTFPTAMHMAAAAAMVEMIPSVEKLRDALDKKAQAWSGIVKVGRTHLQDATPLTLGQEFSGYVSQLDRCVQRCRETLDGLYDLAIGGTAVGTGLNAHPEFAERAARKIAELTKLPFRSHPNKFAALASHDEVVYASGSLKTLAAALMKIANDIRWLGSGPRAGIGELILPENEPGSSIMPGKVNPVIPEVMNQVAFEVIGNDVTITMASEAGQLQLNAFEPIMGYAIHKSIKHLTRACETLQVNCVEGIQANHALLAKRVAESVTLVTALNPIIGYERAAMIAKAALASGGTIAEVAEGLGIMSRAEMGALLVPEKLTQPLRVGA
jgi:fumarate hydratase class II